MLNVLLQESKVLIIETPNTAPQKLPKAARSSSRVYSASLLLQPSLITQDYKL